MCIVVCVLCTVCESWSVVFLCVFYVCFVNVLCGMCVCSMCMFYVHVYCVCMCVVCVCVCVFVCVCLCVLCVLCVYLYVVGDVQCIYSIWLLHSKDG